MSDAKFKIRKLPDGAWSPYDDRGFDCAAGDELEVQLESLPALDARNCRFFFAARSKNAGARSDWPALPGGGTSVYASPPTAAVQLTIPSSGSHAWLLFCQVNGGEPVKGADGRPDYTVNTKGRIIAVRTANGLRKMLSTERTEYAPEGGWADAQNEEVELVDQAIAALVGVQSLSVEEPLFDDGTAADPSVHIRDASGATKGSMSTAHYNDLANATDAANASTLAKRNSAGVLQNKTAVAGATVTTGVAAVNSTAASGGSPALRSPAFVLEGSVYSLGSTIAKRWGVYAVTDAGEGASWLYFSTQSGSGSWNEALATLSSGGTFTAGAFVGASLSTASGALQLNPYGGAAVQLATYGAVLAQRRNVTGYAALISLRTSDETSDPDALIVGEDTGVAEMELRAAGSVTIFSGSTPVLWGQSSGVFIGVPVNVSKYPFVVGVETKNGTDGFVPIAANDTTPTMIAAIAVAGVANASGVLYGRVFARRNDTRLGFTGRFQVLYHVASSVITIDSADWFEEGDNTSLSLGSGGDAVTSFLTSGGDVEITVTMTSGQPATTWVAVVSKVEVQG